MTAEAIYSSLGLSRNPFPPTPDAGSYFFTPRLEEDFAEIVHCIEARKGFVLLTGEVGLGKSTLVRRLLDTMAGKKCHSALILNTFLQDSALLSAIQADFGLPSSDSVEQGLAQLTEFLIAGHQAGEIKLLVIDDAQNLSVQSLELVRLLCNLETGQEKLLQILLVGQTELEQTLAKPELRQLQSRIVKHARLSGLSREEVPRYFDFRVNAAGAEGRLAIDTAAADALYRATQGNVRRIHLVLDRCLYGLAGSRQSTVTAALIQRAVSDLPSLGSLPAAAGKVRGRTANRKMWVMAGLIAGTTATVAIAGLGWMGSQEKLQATRPMVVAPSAVSAPASGIEPAGAEAKESLTVVSVATSAAVSAVVPAPAVAESARAACERAIKASANSREIVEVQRLPLGVVVPLISPARTCRFVENNEVWLAWLGRSEAQQIQDANQTTRAVQIRLRNLGLLDAKEPNDGLFGLRTAEAFARFQQQQGLAVTGRPDELTLLFLEYQDATPR